MNAKLTARDERILAKCALCRWLTTTQIQRLYFPKASVNAVQKRLRKLTDAGYLRAHRENQMAEAVYAVGPKGKPLVEEQGLEVGAGDAPKQLEHLTGINSIRIAFEASGLALIYFSAHWQLANLGWTFPVIPDAVVGTGTRERHRFLVEYDRGTEPLKTILDKLRAYSQGISGFAADAVLLVTEENRSLDRLGREVRKGDIQLPCLAAGLAEVERVLTEPIFVDLSDGTWRTLLAPQ
jgi:hypothetical protein